MNEKIIEKLTSNFGISKENYQSIINISKMIVEQYKSAYNSANIFQNEIFYQNAKFNAFIKNIDDITLISEKVIRRYNDIGLIGKRYQKLYPELYSYAKELSNEINNLLDMEIFWIMDYLKANNIKLNEGESSCLEYMINIGLFYLNETQEFCDIYTNVNNKRLEKRI